jgi:non-ribosomal peptide synthetase component F
VAQLTNPGFDVVLRDVFLRLTCGATLCIPADPEILEPAEMINWLSSERVSVLHIVPTMAQSYSWPADP